MDKKLKVAIYCRVASESQYAVDSQKAELTRYALSLGYDNLAYYEDNGASGLTLDRSGFKQMDSDIQSGRIGAVLVKNISRIGRKPLQTTHWIDCIIDKGIPFISMTDPYERLALPDMERICRELVKKQLSV